MASELVAGLSLIGGDQRPDLSCPVDGNADATMKNVATAMKIDAFMPEPSLETGNAFWMTSASPPIGRCANRFAQRSGDEFFLIFAKLG
jgi:hypothetical protein